MNITFPKIYLCIAFLGISFLSAQARYTPKQIDSLLVSNEKPNNWDLKKNIDFLNKLFKESEIIHYEAGMCQSLMKIINWYMQKGQYNDALPYFEKIKNLRLENPENYKYKANALQSKATALIGLGLYDDAQLAINESITIINRLKGDVKYRILGDAYDKEAYLYIEMKKPEDSVLSNLKKSALQYRKIKKESQRNILLNSAYINISNSFFELKKMDSAMFYSHKALKNKYLSDESNSYVLQMMGQIHRQQNSLDSAFYYYKRAEVISTKLGDPLALKGIYQTLSEMYNKSGDKDNAFQYAKKNAHLSDSLNVINKESAAIANKSIKQELQKENESQKKSLYWIVGIIITTLSVASIYLAKKFNREKKEKLEKREIIEQKNIELQVLKSKVNDSFEQIITLAKKNDSTLICRFQEVYPDFCDKLQQICPDILNSELIFCAYLKLNFSTKEIANYTFTAVKSVQNRKNKIRKRLGIPSDEDIYIWINSI